MERQDLQPLLNTYLRQLKHIDLRFVRYLYDDINWASRIVGIKGPRGVGKTTLLLQRIARAFASPDEAFYASLDDLWFETRTLPELVDFLYARGMRHIFLDEVHKYPQWARVVKNLYDSYPDLQIVYTGSSLVAIDHSVTDLSRRQSLYDMRGLSFREYLAYECSFSAPRLTLPELLADHTKIAMNLSAEMPVLKHFEDYLERGYYPYYKEAGPDYYGRLREGVKLVMEVDVPSTTDVSYATMAKIKELLMVIAPQVPLQPNVRRLCGQLETSRDNCLRMLDILHRARLIRLLHAPASTYKHLTSPQKIYLDNPNLMYALSATVSEGTARETFFANQAAAAGELTMPAKGDFCLDGKYIFEVGGAGKTYHQIADMPHSYLAVDNIELGMKNSIPLWMFGLLY